MHGKWNFSVRCCCITHTHTHNWEFTHTVGDSTATSSSSSVWNFILYIIAATAGLAMNFSAHSIQNTRVLNYKQCDLHFYFSKYEQNMRCIYLRLTVEIILCMAEWTSSDSNKRPIWNFTIQNVTYQFEAL